MIEEVIVNLGFDGPETRKLQSELHQKANYEITDPLNDCTAQERWWSHSQRSIKEKAREWRDRDFMPNPSLLRISWACCQAISVVSTAVHDEKHQQKAEENQVKEVRHGLDVQANRTHPHIKG